MPYEHKLALLHITIYDQYKPTFTVKIQIFTVTYLISSIKLCSRGKDFQTADSVGEIVTAIQDTVFPALEQGTETTKNNFTLIS